MPEEPEEDDIVEEADDEEDEEVRTERGERGEREDGENGRGRRRRRRRRRGGERERTGEEREALPVGDMPMPLDAPQPDIDVAPFSGERIDQVEGNGEESEDGRDERGRRRRGRRGGRRNRRDRDENGNVIATEGEAETDATEVAADIAEARSEPVVLEAFVEPVQPIRVAEPAPAPEPTPQRDEPPVARAPEPEPEPVTTEPVVVGDPTKPKKGGWWARAKAGLTGQ
jgi:ribonuclease E